MRIAMFSAKPYDRETFERVNGDLEAPHELTFMTPHLDRSTAVLAEGADAVCAFVNDDVDAETLEILAERGVKLLLMRCAGYNNVDVAAAERLGLAIGRVPAYSPHAVAEHTIALILGLNRRLHRAYNRVREGNFELDGLMGFDLHGKTVGVVGTGRIGICTIRILAGFGCRVLAADPHPADEAREAGADYVDLPDLLEHSDIVTLHCPLTPGTHHLIDETALASMRNGAYLINTSRGGLIDTRAVIRALKSGQLGGLAIDVYEEEGDLFFENLSGQVLQDDIFARLLTFPNVLVTGHQAFFTEEALNAIARTSLANATAFEAEGQPEHAVTVEMMA
ncbi:2-hydroxyacid dehydrogenase [Jannaschia aquimarina]|uniref:LdhA protein n=1 Tax=Jannaschia aquimarina TaxID=935700 RepID=A0A0D1EHL6_9RHOB|nr:2-hydroxyacid dehydrogenase [Jannaschia aquimarina]KIT17174.1 D-lactate dehydrogenase [Jannaschia aquimarina]SNT17808.1 D-lactate dehydrogenase [Jannaschia aquimarina]